MAAEPATVTPTPADSTGDLVERCQRGDQSAFSELFKLHHERVYATIYHLVRRKDELEDVVQTIFLEVFRSIGRFEGRSQFTTWLTRVAINVAHSHERRLRLRWATNLSAELEPLTVLDGGLNPQPDERLLGKERALAARRLLDRLSSKKRTVLVLADMLELSAPEIADVLDVPPATVRTRLFYARRDFERLAQRDAVLSDLPEPGGQE